MSSFPKYVRVRQVSLKIKKFTEERFFVNKKSVDLMLFGFFHDEHTKNRGFESLPLRNITLSCLLLGTWSIINPDIK